MNDQNDHDFTGGDLKAAVTGWTPNRRRFLSVAGLAVGGAVVGTTAAGCGTAQTGNTSGGDGEAKGRAGAAGETLFVGRVPVGSAEQLQPVRRQSRLAHGLGPEPADLRDPAALQPARRLAGRRSGQGAAAARRQHLRAAAAGRHQVVRRQRADRRRRRLHLRAGQETALSFSTIWHYVDCIEATDPRTVTFKLKAKPYNPGFVKNFLATTLIVPKAVFEQASPRTRSPPSTNLKPIGSGPFLLDKYDQTQVNLKRNDNYWGKDVFGTPAMTDDQPPDLQEQQRRRPEAGERRDRRQPAVHRPDLEDVGGRASRSAPG